MLTGPPLLDTRRDAQVREGIVRTQQEIANLDLDLPAILTVMAEKARMLTGATGGTVELLEGDELVCRASAGGTAREVGVRLKREGSLSGVVVRDGETVYCADILSDPRINQDYADRIKARSLIAAPLRAGGEVIGVLKVLAGHTHAFTPEDVGNLQILVESLGATIQRHRVSAQLRASEAQYRLLFDHNPQPMWVYAIDDLRFLAVNRSCVLQYGYSEADFLDMSVLDLSIPEDKPAVAKRVAELPKDAKLFNTRRRHARKDGTVIDADVSADGLVFNGRQARLVMAVNVTERLRAERDLARVSRAQRMLSACNEAQARTEDEITLLQEICRVAVEIGGYRLAHVGYAEMDKAKTLRWVAWAGMDGGYLSGINLSWAEGDPAGLHGPSRRVIHTGAPVIMEDLAQEEGFRPWLGRAQAFGFNSLVALPLKNSERTFGLLTMLAADVAHIGQDEIKLLEEFANDLAFGIGHIRAQQERQRFQETVLKVATAVSAKTGVAFFVQLATNMAEALGAHVGLVGRFLPGERMAQAHTLALVVDGQVLPNFDYPLALSEQESLSHNEGAVVRHRAGERFTDAPLLAQFGAQGYAWQRLDNSLGQPIGVALVMFQESLTQTDFITSTLRIFAARCAAEIERQEADARIRNQASLLDKAQDAIIVRSMDDRLLYWNKGAERLYGWTAEEVLGMPLGLNVYRDVEAYRAAGRKLLEHGELVSEFEQRDRHGNDLVIEGRWTLLRDDEDQPVSILSISTDITKRKASEREIHRLAFYDPLTKLPNRLLLVDRLQQAVTAGTRTGVGGALLFIDLDNFKTLNDTLGHDIGDLLLQQVAARLVGCVREMDTVARFGGDEFVVMLEDVNENPNEVAVRVRQVGEKILHALNAPYTLAGYEHRSTCSIGVAPFRNHQDSVGELLKHADLAMYQAKASGRNTLRFFDPEMQAVVTARAALEVDLRQALVNNEFLLHYQPQVDAVGQATGVEALVRWQHPQRGMVSPAQFIPLAEETGMIIPLGLWVLQTACALLASWKGNRWACMTVAVNVSPRQFRHPDFVAQVVAVLKDSGAPPETLKLELTESLLVDDMDIVVAKMSALKSLGVGFSLDDFGTGYSSLSYLKRLPLDQLKIDQSFVRDVLSDPNDAAIARTIIALGQSLGLNVIAEGVETQDQRDFLQQHGCDAYQGYLFSRPLPEAQLMDYLQAR